MAQVIIYGNGKTNQQNHFQKLFINFNMQTITDLKPTDIRYEHNGIWVKDQFIESANPRLAFAKQLAEIPDNGHMYGREGSWVHSRVMCDWRTIKWGLNCVIGGTGFGYERDEAGFLW